MREEGELMGSRYISRGCFGVFGVSRVSLLETISNGLFVVDYREKATGNRVRHRLGTSDLGEAKKKISDLVLELERGRSMINRVKGETVLYVIQRGNDGPIKIGFTRNLKSRLAQLQSASAEKLHVLRVYKMADVEKAIHAELERASRLEGEWFPADLLPSVDRFFRVGFDVVLKRRRSRLDGERAMAERLVKAGLL